MAPTTHRSLLLAFAQAVLVPPATLSPPGPGLPQSRLLSLQIPKEPKKHCLHSEDSSIKPSEPKLLGKREAGECWVWLVLKGPALGIRCHQQRGRKQASSTEDLSFYLPASCWGWWERHLVSDHPGQTGQTQESVEGILDWKEYMESDLGAHMALLLSVYGDFEDLFTPET